jgi:hypothetical protein
MTQNREAVSTSIKFHFEFEGMALKVNWLTLGSSWLTDELAAGPIHLHGSDQWQVEIRKQVQLPSDLKTKLVDTQTWGGVLSCVHLISKGVRERIPRSCKSMEV